MAQKTINLPNGKTVTVNVPDGATDEQVLRFVKREYDAGRIGQEVAPGDAPEQVGQSDELSFLDKLIGGAELTAAVGSGILAEPVAGLMGIGAALDPTQEAGAGARAVDRYREMLSYQPQTESGKRALQNFAEIMAPVGEAIENTSKSVGQDAMATTGSPLVASMFEAMPTAALELIGAKVGSARKLSELQKADVEKLKREVTEDIRAKEKQFGIPLMTSDVFTPETRLQRFMQEQGEIITSGKRNEQQQKRLKSVENLLGVYSVSDSARFEPEIIGSLKNSVDTFKRKMGEQYDNSSAKLDELGDFELTETKKLADEIIKREETKGTLADTALIKQMQNLQDSPDMPFLLVKDIRSKIGADMQAIERGAPVQGSNDLAKLKRIYSTISKDMGTFAFNTDENLAKLWKEADAEYSAFTSMAKDKSAFKNAVKKGEATPEIVNNLLFSNKLSDVKFLANNLDEAGKSAAKGQVLQRVLQKSTNNTSGEINPNAFARELRKNRNQVSSMFNKQERQAIEDLRSILVQTGRAQEASAAAPTGRQLLLPFLGAASIGALGGDAASIGAIMPTITQAVIETPAIRNLLVKRKAAKTARERFRIDKEIEAELQAAGAIGAGATAGALTGLQNAFNYVDNREN